MDRKQARTRFGVAVRWGSGWWNLAGVAGFDSEIESSGSEQVDVVANLG